MRAPGESVRARRLAGAPVGGPERTAPVIAGALADARRHRFDGEADLLGPTADGET